MAKKEMVVQIGAELQRIRKERGLTQEELAKRIDTNRSTIANYEQGTREIGWKLFVKWCNACGVKPSEFVDNIENYAYD